jgi:hypothetical protein
VPRRRGFDPLAVISAAAIAAFIACSPSEQADSSTVVHTAAESRLAGYDCNRPQNARGPSTIESIRAPHRLAWWLTVQFVPTADSILALPISRLDSSWAQATVLTREMMPRQARADPGVLGETTFGFCLNGDFNADGLGDRAAVGVYRTRAGVQGRFLMIITAIGPDRWQKAFLHSMPGDPGFSILSLDRTGGLGWWTCMKCDSWSELAWADSQYVLKHHPGRSGGVEDTVAY